MVEENVKNEQSNVPNDEQKSSSVSSSKTSSSNEKTVVIGGEQIAIKKLKAGEFYKLQKVFGEILRSTVSSGEDVNAMDSDQLARLFTELPEKVAEFVSICAGMSKEDLLEQAYPEEIAEAFGVGLALNNVIENLKKSVAPMQALGAEVKV
jgi:hypothetical protein